MIPGLIQGRSGAVTELAALMGSAPGRLDREIDAAGSELSVDLPGTVS